MQMHRVKQKPDWEYVAVDERTLWQRLAAVSHGIITPANIVTLFALSFVVSGAALVVDGIYLLGFVFIATGRLLDLADGAVAERTQTKGPLGEALDSIADKIAFLLVFIVFALEAIMSLWLLAGLVVLQLANSVVVIGKKLKGEAVHTTRWGKYGSLLLWSTIGMFSVVFVLEASSFAAIYQLAANILAHVLYILTVVFGLLTTKSYLQFKKNE